jgi:hypothetical protein
MAGSCSISVINNRVSKESRSDCFEIFFKKSDADDNTSIFSLGAARHKTAEMDQRFPAGGWHLWQSCDLESGAADIADIEIGPSNAQLS